ncbi:uncharacterized protein LOC114961829 [Acropora millepora]|uniref:uncharacterized protein LOC114961829 n=1 Tax=Acropora millepora TaxID=45264 RepID=UPI001CF2E4B5|nr:uncharacterized protein LOC114961829 [Acropora millepora]XP_044183904.1 uncharacterized protein LOC114961829 [Acropora millepora]
MDDGVTRINVREAESDQMTTGSFEAGTSQKPPPPYDQQFGTVQAAPVGHIYNQQLGTVQIAAVCPPYSCNQQIGALPVAPEGGYFNTSPAPDVTNNTHPHQESHIVAAEPPEPDCYFYCFNCSKDYQWYDLRGKGLCWILLLLLLWLTVGVVTVLLIVIAMVLASIFGFHVKEQ